MGQTIFQYKHFPTDPLYFPVEPASTTVIEEALRDTIHIPYFAPVGGADTIARLIPSGKVIFSGIEFKLFMFYFKYEFELFNFLKLRSLYFIIGDANNLPLFGSTDRAESSEINDITPHVYDLEAENAEANDGIPPEANPTFSVQDYKNQIQDYFNSSSNEKQGYIMWLVNLKNNPPLDRLD